MFNELEFGGKIYKPDVRLLSDMSDVIYDREWLQDARDVQLYYMYRDLALTDSDREILRKENLRYDITLIPPNSLGREFVKTAGHYHPKIPGSGLSYTEIYEVLEGRAHYLLQERIADEITDVVLVKAEKGDKVIIPPNYGHITINPTNTLLKMANLVSDRFSSIYEPIKEKHGGAYFELTNGEFIQNNNYKNLPLLRFMEARDLSEFGITKDIYSLIENTGALGFLNNPSDFMELFLD